jgi:hypothetical protein
LQFHFDGGISRGDFNVKVSIDGGAFGRMAGARDQLNAEAERIDNDIGRPLCGVGAGDGGPEYLGRYARALVVRDLVGLSEVEKPSTGDESQDSQGEAGIESRFAHNAESIGLVRHHNV